MHSAANPNRSALEDASRFQQRFPGTQSTQLPGATAARPEFDRHELLKSYLGHGAQLASFDSYNEDQDSPSEETPLCRPRSIDDAPNSAVLLEGPRLKKPAKTHPSLPKSSYPTPAILHLEPSSHYPEPSHSTDASHPSPLDQTMDTKPDSKPCGFNAHPATSPSQSLDTLPESQGYPYDPVSRSSSQQPPAYSLTEDPMYTGNPESMSPFSRFRSAAVGVHAVVRLNRVQRFQKRAKWASKKLLVFTLSKVGLTCLVGLYAIAGAFLFQHLEGGEPEASTPAARAAASTTGTALVMMNNTEVKREIDALRDHFIVKMWNTTVELNVLHPDTWRQNIGADVHSFEKHLLEILKLHSGESSSSTVTTAAPQAVRQDEVEETEDKWSYSTALLFSVAVITTIGYGDIVPKTPAGKVACMFYGLVGIPMMLLCLANIGGFLATCFRFIWKHSRHLCLVDAKNENQGGSGGELEETNKVRVPMSLVLLVLFLYLMIGAFLFAGWESWSILDGSYFCFVTLSTIGFGDLVPGKNTNTLNSNAQRVVCALYLLFGLSLVAMVFQLMQDTVLHISARYAEFLGLTKEQIQKDKDVGVSEVADAGPGDVEENSQKLLENRTGEYGGPGCSDTGWDDVSRRPEDVSSSESKQRMLDDAEVIESDGDWKSGADKQHGFGRSNPDKTTLKASQDSGVDDEDNRLSKLDRHSKTPEKSEETGKPAGKEKSKSLLKIFKRRKPSRPRPDQTRSLCVQGDEDVEQGGARAGDFHKSLSLDPESIDGSTAAPRAV